MALPTTYINTTHVRNALGEDENKVKEDLCTSPYINRWSAYKPIENPDYISTQFENLMTIMSNANFGLQASAIPEIPLYSLNGANVGQTIPANVSNIMVWPYIRPTSKFRIGDFRGYNHQALPFIHGVYGYEWYPTTEELSAVLWYPNFTWGEASYESIGSSVNIEIPLTYLNIDNHSFQTEEWRLGLAFPGTDRYYIAASEWALKDITDGTNINKAFVRFDLDYQCRAYLNGLAGSPVISELHPIPFIGYNLQYIINGDGGNDYFQWGTGGAAYCFPFGEQSIPFTIYGGNTNTGLSASCTYALIEYLTGVSLDSLNVNFSAVNEIMHPGTGYADVTAARFTMKFDVTNETSNNITVTLSDFRQGLAGSNSGINIVYKVDNTSYSGGTLITFSPGTPRTVELTYTESLASEPFLHLMRSLPVYDGTSPSQVSLAFKLILNGTTIGSRSSVIHLVTTP